MTRLGAEIAVSMLLESTGNLLNAALSDFKAYANDPKQYADCRGYVELCVVSAKESLDTILFLMGYAEALLDKEKKSEGEE